MLYTAIATKALLPFPAQFHDVSNASPAESAPLGLVLTVVGYIVLAINVGADDRLDLHKHIVQRRGHGSGAGGIRYAAAPAYLYWMRSWKG